MENLRWWITHSPAVIEKFLEAKARKRERERGANRYEKCTTDRCAWRDRPALSLKTYSVLVMMMIWWRPWWWWWWGLAFQPSSSITGSHIDLPPAGPARRRPSHQLNGRAIWSAFRSFLIRSNYKTFHTILIYRDIHAQPFDRCESKKKKNLEKQNSWKLTEQFFVAIQSHWRLRVQISRSKKTLTNVTKRTMSAASQDNHIARVISDVKGIHNWKEDKKKSQGEKKREFFFYWSCFFFCQEREECAAEWTGCRPHAGARTVW